MANLDFKNKTLVNSIIGSVIGAAMIILFFCTPYLPFGYPNQRNKLNALKDDYEKKSTDLTRARAAVADLPRFEAEYEQLHDRWTAASELLPADRQLAALLRKITLAGQQTGVSFVMFKPDAPLPQNYYSELPVQIAVFGGYHQVGSFLAEVANLHRIVTVSNLKLATNQKGDGLASTMATMTASTYSLNTSVERDRATATPSKKKENGPDGRKQS